MTDTQVAIIGGGAAGIAAAHYLHNVNVPYKLLEARPRLGGRAWTTRSSDLGFPIDLGCGWLHSADRNPWTEIATSVGFTLDKTPPPWTRPSSPVGFPLAQQKEFHQALAAFYQRLGDVAAKSHDSPASNCLLPSDPWSSLIGAVATFIAGAELNKVSAVDLHRYSDTEINWRVVEGYGSLIVAFASKLDAMLNCAVIRIDHREKRIKIETTLGVLECDRALITIPTSLLATETIEFVPPLPDKVEAASRLPLGLNNKLFLSLTHAEEFEKDSRLFGRTDTVATATYHLKPFGRPLIEAYFGGELAHSLEKAGNEAFYDFAKSELTGLLGHDFGSRIRPVGLHAWGSDIYSCGAYSYAVPGHADSRSALTSPVDGRIYFAGEACSESQFSTAHGAYLTGVAAATRIAALQSHS